MIIWTIRIAIIIVGISIYQNILYGGDLENGRPVRVVSICFNAGRLTLEEVSTLVDKEGAEGADIIALPETFMGQNNNNPETLKGRTISTMSALAEKHSTYIVCPIDRVDGKRRVNSSVLLDREGKTAGIYDKVYPYWAEFDLEPIVNVGSEPKVFDTDFGRVGMLICFDANFPQIWEDLAEKGAELVIWPSAYSAGTSLRAHAINHQYYIVTATYTGDCQVYDINGERILDEKTGDVTISRITLDLDRGIYHTNFNTDRLDKLLAEHGEEVVMEKFMERESWFILKATKPGISARKLARQYGLEELRDYKIRSRREIDKMRGRDPVK